MIRRCLAAGMVLAALVVFVAGAPAAGAADLEAVGWWARTATSTPGSESPTPLPASPSVPVTVPSGAGVGPNQVLVEGTPEGATAIAALKWTLTDTESTPSLVLPAAAGSALTLDSVVLACKAATEWEPPPSRPGTWESKPITDGTSCINGVVAADGSSVAFGLQPLVRRTTLDVVLVAGTDPRLPDGANGSAFRLVFDDPTADSLRTIKSGAPSASAAPSTQPSSGFDDSVLPRASLAPSLSELRAPDSSGAAAPALDPQDVGPSVPRLEPVAATAPGNSTPRTLAALLLLGGAAIATWLRRSASGPGEPALVGLGRFRRVVEARDTPMDPQVRGLAGFARPRTKPPTPL